MSRRERDLRFDLHMHSTRSDGALSPAEVLRRCAAGGLDVIALTDHDIAPALPPGARVVAGRRVLVLHGVELSATWQGRELHLLVYFPGEMPSEFADLCRRQVQERADRYDAAARATGLDLPLADEAARRGERAITRAHLAAALVARGHAANLGEAYARWAGNGAGLFPHFSLGLLDAIDAARQSGGFTSWAHPDPRHAADWAGDLARGGLHALEAVRPGSRPLRDALQRVAWRHKLAITGGSDFHSPGGAALGAFSLPGRLAPAWMTQRARDALAETALASGGA